MVDFFSDELIDDPVVTPEDQWTEVTHLGWNARVRQMVRLVTTKRLQPSYTIIPPGGGSKGDPYAHAGEEFGLVLKGILTLTVDNEIYRVRAMSAFYYSSLLLHSWVNEEDMDCHLVWVVTPPSW